MIKLMGSMRAETREAMRGGKGAIKLQHLFEKGEYRGHTRLVAKITLPPGCSIGPHEHGDEEEIFYILKGRARVVDAGETRELGPGDASLTGGGKSHAIENIGDGDLELIATILTY